MLILMKNLRLIEIGTVLLYGATISGGWRQLQGLGPLNQFTCPQPGALAGSNIQLEGGLWYLITPSADNCARACISTTGCLSFDYSILDYRCYLGDAKLDISTGLILSSGYFYYEMGSEEAEGCIYGCTAENSFNYDPAATADNGACVTKVEGCGDPTALNYNVSVNHNTSNCVYSILGMEFACPVPGSWIYSADLLSDRTLTECADFCLADSRCVGFLSDRTQCLVSFSQPQPSGDNATALFFYERLARSSEAACTYGCMDAEAPNFKPGAEAEDGTCQEQR
jgi:hypothetical protein